MSALPYMPLYVADYLADAAHLTTEEHGAYLLLIMTYWQRGKPLPADPDRLARIARMPSERWADVQRTLSEFFALVDGHWHHKRIDAELDKVRDKSEKAKKAASVSASSRKTAPAEQTLSGRSTDAEQTLSECSTDAERTLSYTDTDTDTDTEEREKGARAQDHFELCREFLDHYAADLDQWEIDFLVSIKPKPSLSKAQAASLKSIQAKIGHRNGNKPPALLTITRGTPAYDAWIAYYRRQSRTGKTFHESKTLLTVPTEYPPQEQAA